jgi:ribosomal protein L15
VNLGTLQRCEEISFDIAKLEELNLIRKLRKSEKAPVKILAHSKEEFNKKITVKANAFSKTAKEIIEKFGGTVEVI